MQLYVVFLFCFCFFLMHVIPLAVYRSFVLKVAGVHPGKTDPGVGVQSGCGIVHTTRGRLDAPAHLQRGFWRWEETGENPIHYSTLNPGAVITSPSHNQQKPPPRREGSQSGSNVPSGDFDSMCQIPPRVC